MSNVIARNRDITETVYIETAVLMTAMTAAFVLVLDAF